MQGGMTGKQTETMACLLSWFLAALLSEIPRLFGRPIAGRKVAAVVAVLAHTSFQGHASGCSPVLPAPASAGFHLAVASSPVGALHSLLGAGRAFLPDSEFHLTASAQGGDVSFPDPHSRSDEG